VVTGAVVCVWVWVVVWRVVVGGGGGAEVVVVAEVVVTAVVVVVAAEPELDDMEWTTLLFLTTLRCLCLRLCLGFGFLGGCLAVVVLG
jgi:hypothetical protein